MTSRSSTESLYDDHAGGWARHAPLLLSDFTARPRVVAALGDLTGNVDRKKQKKGGKAAKGKRGSKRIKKQQNSGHMAPNGILRLVEAQALCKA